MDRPAYKRLGSFIWITDQAPLEDFMDKEKIIYALQMALYLMTDKPELARMYINSTIDHIRSDGVANNCFNLTQ
jgi:hypothetical protein